MLGIKKRRWKKVVMKFLAEMKKSFPAYQWDDFYKIAEHFHWREMSSLTERAFLFRLARDLPANAKVAEIGSWIGESTCYLATGLTGSEARLYAVDRFSGYAGTLEEQRGYEKKMTQWEVSDTKILFDKNVAHFGLGGRVRAIIADSVAATHEFPEPAESLDLLFIDGDHSEESAQKDLNAWLGFVKPGGIVLFHDFSSLCGVPPVVWRAAQDHKLGEIIGIYGTLLAARKP
jgi:predicted O-methyltransferase YrrM